jgi:hypothetical protein
MMNVAAGSLLQIVADPSAAILVTRLDAVLRRPGLDEGTIGGTAQVEVVRELTRDRWHGAPGVPLAFSRYESPRMAARTGGLGFNGVELTLGNLLLVALPDVPEAQCGRPIVAALAALAVAPLDAPDGPLARGVEGALAVEAAKDDEPLRLCLVREALGSSLPFLVEYGHYAAGRLARIPRPAAIAMEIELLADEARPARDRAMAEATLELELWREGEPEDPENRRIVEAFFASLGTPDRELRGHLVQALHAMIAPGAEPGGEEAQRAAWLDALIRRHPEIGALVR